MPTIEIDGAELFYVEEGEGPPLVLVHGGWSAHVNWAAIVPELARTFRVIAYDRRGHSRSGKAPGRLDRARHEDDLAAIIETLADGGAHVVGTSYGSLVALGLAARRPDLVDRVSAHEPPAMSLATGDLAEEVGRVLTGFEAILGEVEAGRCEEAARRFVEELILQPGAWAMFPEEVRATFVENAPAFAAEQRDPEWDAVDLGAVAASGREVLITRGEASPDWLSGLASKVAAALPGARQAVVAGAGHSPHLTHPQALAEIVTTFLRTGAPPELAAR